MQMPPLCTLGSIFESNEQFEIPRFQRKYEWSIKSDIPTLWDDIYSSAITKKDHFIGSIIVIPFTNDTTRFMLIDGQQRIITFSILIKALREFVEKEGNIDWPELCYGGIYIKNYGRRKVVRTSADGGKFNLIMDTEKHYGGRQDNYERCYQFFYEKLKAIHEGTDPDVSINDIMNTVWKNIKLMPVSITNEDPCILFQSINNTGRKLTPISMMRNYVMLKCVSIENNETSGMIQKDIDDNYWTPFDKLCTENQLGEYLRTFLTTKKGRISKNDLYVKSKEYVDEYFDNCTTHEEIKTAANHLFVPLTNYYELYEQVLGTKKFKGNSNDAVEIQNSIDIINDYGFMSHRPFMLKLLMDYDNKADDKGNHTQADLSDLKDKMALLESFIVRRAIYQDLPNNTVDVMFIELSQIDDISYDEIYKKMDEMSNRGMWPTDDDIRDSLGRKEFYCGLSEKFCYSVLKRISAHMNENLTEKIDDSSPTTEHIFPQDSKKWIDDYSKEDYKFLCDHLHFLGNLTPLTRPKNSDASNEIYSVKLKVYEKSNYKMTKDIEKTYGMGWNVEKFKTRQTDLEDKIIEIWSRKNKNDKSDEEVESAPVANN